MILSFDKFERYELPQVTLCNPNSRATEVDGKITITDTVGVLSNPKGMNLKLNFNAPHELSFDYYRHKSTNPIKQSFYDKIYEAIQTDRYIYLTDIGYFVISSVTDSDEDNIDKKSISLKSCEENELATAEGLHLKEGTYYLHTDNKDGLLDLFLPKTAGWTMGYIDPSLLTKPYFVEDTEVDNGYNFLYTTIQDMFECIVEPDIIKRTISVYSRTYYAEHHLTDIHIAKYNLLKHKTVEENDEDKYTALNVQGKDENLEIRVVNPTGKNVIYNFDSRHSMMSPDLQVAVVKWQEKCESVEEEYLTLQQGYYNDMQNIVFPLEQDIKVLELQLKQQQQTRDLIVIGEQDKAIKVVEVLPETGKSNILYFVPTTVNNYEEYVWENNSWKYIALIQVDDISDTNQQRALDLVNAAINNTNIVLSEKQSMLEDEKNKIQTNYSERINQINSECALETTDIFTTELRNELMTHIKPTEYVDEYMLVTESMTYPQRFEKAKELMDRAQSQLVKISSGQKTYSIDTRSFLFNKQFKHFSEQLCAGAIIYVETKNDIMEQLHLTGIGINFDEKTADLTLGNKYDRSDLKALYEDALGQNSKSFSELKYIASIVEDQQKQLDYQKNWVADLRTLTLDNVLTSEDQAIEINNRGLIGRKRQLNEDGTWKTDENDNPLFDPEQIKIINNTIVFTDDNWNSAATAVGKIAVGYNSDGSVKYSYGINGQVLIGELILGNNLVLTGTGAGIKIKDNGGKDTFYADSKGNLVLLGHIRAKSLTLEGCTISTNDISGLSNVAISGKYDDLLGKPEIPTSVNDLGFDTSEIIYKGDIKQSTKTDSNGIEYIQTTVPTKNGTIIYDTYNAGDYIVFGGHKGTDADGQNYICISKDGLLTARNALIYGTVYATEGDIGGWHLADTYMDTKATYINPASTSKARFYIAALENSSSKILSATDSTGKEKFYVSDEGILYAQGATIEGTLTATAGKVADWTIISGKMRSETPFSDNAKDLYTVIKGTGEVALATMSPEVDGATTGATAQIFHDGRARFGRHVNNKTDSSDSAYSLVADTSGTKIYKNMHAYCKSKFDKLCNFRGGITVGSKSLASDPHSESINVSTYGMVYIQSDTRYVRMNGYSYSDGAAFYVGQKTASATSWTTKFSVHWDGGVRGYGFSEPSDQNLKKDISYLDERYSVLFDNLSPKTYRYIHGDSGRLHTGLVAQEVKKAMDIAKIDTLEFAAYVKDDIDGEETLSLRYSEFVALLINEVQKLKKETQNLKLQLSSEK